MSLTPSHLSAIVTDRYRIEKELGAGGMATVYLAHDIRHDRQVALKVLRPELGVVLGAERFLTEIKITARLDHPHILTLIDSGAVDGLLYYVLPYVRGESLRDLLNRETQLGVDAALAITKQVASALDYAHRHGVIHRDIKPENILLQEGEAMLADFGIALAVKEAGGSRLTETGLSLGTPQYMSPEQATGDRQLDARSDQYSLAAVLYEMLTGEPPMTGPTVQAVIAKLLTEPPTRIRTVRGTVPEGVDAAVARALSKVPADRFASAGEFVRALEATSSVTGAVPAVKAGRSLRPAVIAGAAVVLLGAAALFGRSLRAGKPEAAVALKDRTQLTFTGSISAPALSGDGKQLAYWVKVCATGGCTYSIEAQDVGSTTTRRVLDGATSGYGLEWSPDRRNLLASGTIGGRYGIFLISVLGGPPRFLTAGAATFFAGGDSLLIGPSGPDSAFTVKVTGLNGTTGGTFRVPGPGQSLATLSVIPGTSRIVSLVIQAPRGLWQLLDRSGKVTDHLVNSCTCGGMAASDAVWMTRAGPTAAEAVVRVAVDPATGKLASRQDTAYTGRFTGFSVTADGSQIAVDDGSFEFTVVAAPLADLLRGKLPQGSPLMQASNQVGAIVSPDGQRLLLRRTLPDANGSNETRVSVAPFSGSPETAIPLTGRLVMSSWVDSVSIAMANQTPKGLHLSVVDVRTSEARNTLDLPDSTMRTAVPLSDGWAWIPNTGDRVVVSRGAARHEIAKPEWFSTLFGLSASPDGSRLLYTGWNASTEDTVGVEVVPIEGGTPSRWASSFAESGGAGWLSDGSVLFLVWDGPETVSLHEIRGPGASRKLGTVPHPVGALSVSGDLARGAMGWRVYKGDAWLYRVAKQ